MLHCSPASKPGKLSAASGLPGWLRDRYGTAHTLCACVQRVSNLLCESNQAKKKAVQRGREAAAKQRTKDRRRR